MRKIGRSSGRAQLLRSVGLGIVIGCIAPCLHAAAPTFAFNISNGSLGAALESYARTTGRQLLYRSRLVDGLRAPTLVGTLDADAALRRLLEGSGLTIRQISANAFVVTRPSVLEHLSGRDMVSERASGVTASRGTDTSVPPVPDDAAAAPASQDIVVTGSNIRGAANPTSPLTTIGRRDIERSGRTSIASILQTLPQNFGGQGTQESLITGVDRSGTNPTLSTAPNLRGLGADATLTLVNGRRVSGSGGSGDFVDVSMLPLAAVERIEVLTDGASALYGADAVGGVVNIILRSDFEGNETRLTGGSATQGGLGHLQLSETFGKHWGSGHALLAYEYDSIARLPAADRKATRSDDLRPLGGTDWRSYYASPGTLLGVDPLTGAITPTYAIPPSSGGHPPAATFRPGENLQNANSDQDIAPREHRHALYATGSQTLATGVDVYAEGRFSQRRFGYRGPAYVSALLVTPANPAYVSPQGNPYELVAYSFDRDIGPQRVNGRVTSASGTLGTKVTPGGGWQIDLYGTHGFEHSRVHYSNLVNETLLAEALGNTPDDPSTGFSTAVDGFFNPFGDGQANSSAVLDFIRQGYSTNRIRSTLDTANIKADGPLFRLPGGSVKMAVGGEFRRDGLASSGTDFSSGTTPTANPDTGAHRDVKAVFAELEIPLVGPGNALPFIRRLDVSLAARYERYSDFGSTSNPKIGLAWSPAPEISWRASWGTSFRAPSLPELNDPKLVVPLSLPNQSGGSSPVLFLLGGNPALRPERARSLSIGGDILPAFIPGLHLSADFFRTRFTNRIGQPALQQILTALTDPALRDFVQPVSPATNAADLAQIQSLLASPGALDPQSFPLTAYQDIVDGGEVNTTAVTVRGLDGAIDYHLPVARGTLQLTMSASYLLDYLQQQTPTSPVQQRAGQVGYPSRLRVRGSVDWTRGRFDTNIAGNFVSREHDETSLVHPRVAAWFTLDGQIAYRSQDRDAKGLSASFSVINLLDQRPPFADRATGYGYDAATATVAGRTVSLALSERW